jgi:hypothetical protein
MISARPGTCGWYSMRLGIQPAINRTNTGIINFFIGIHSLFSIVQLFNEESDEPTDCRNTDVCFGSLAAPLADFSVMAALERIAAAFIA